MTSPIGAISSATNIHKGIYITTGDDMAQGSTNFINFSVTNTSAANETLRDWDFPGIVATGMRVETGNDVGGSAQTYIVTLRVDAADTALVVTLNTGEQSGSDLGEAVAISAGSKVVVEIVSSATSGTIEKPVVTIEYTVDS